MRSRCLGLARLARERMLAPLCARPSSPPRPGPCKPRLQFARNICPVREGTREDRFLALTKLFSATGKNRRVPIARRERANVSRRAI